MCANQVVNSVTQMCTFQTYTLPKACAENILMVFNDLYRLPFPLPHIFSFLNRLPSLDNRLSTNTSLSPCANNPNSHKINHILNGFLWQWQEAQLLHRFLGSRLEASSTNSPAGESSGESGSNFRYVVIVYPLYPLLHSRLIF